MIVLSRHWMSLLALAALCAALIVMVPKRAHAQSGYYTTRTQSTSTSSTVNGVTTTNTNSITARPRDVFSTYDDRRRAGDLERTSDLEARYPYDNTYGRNRSDVDSVRSGFDDPRNPWDGRYVNDNPRNSAGARGANDTVNAVRGNEHYAPGRYGTYSVTRGRSLRR